MIILVTGATTGFGAATVRRFVANGDQVIATGRRTELLTKLKTELGNQVHTFTLDVCSPDQVKTFFENSNRACRRKKQPCSVPRK